MYFFLISAIVILFSLLLKRLASVVLSPAMALDPHAGSERLQRITRKLLQLIEQDPGMKVFGADLHRYRSKRVGAKEIERFEAKHNIELPDELRQILMHIGYGAGPYYGLFSLDSMEQEFESWCSYLDSSSQLNGTAQLNNAIASDVFSRRAADPKEQASFKLTHVNGLLPLLTEGCTYYSFVVLTGEQRGKVWALDTNDMEVMPHGRTQDQTVFDCYEEWLDRSLKGEWTFKGA